MLISPKLGLSGRTAVAFLNTDIAASFAAIVWLAVGWYFEKRPTFLGLLTGAVAGLATITPAAGYVSPVGAVLIGSAAGLVNLYVGKDIVERNVPQADADERLIVLLKSHGVWREPAAAAAS